MKHDINPSKAQYPDFKVFWSYPSYIIIYIIILLYILLYYDGSKKLLRFTDSSFNMAVLNNKASAKKKSK